jgi:glycosyltransferase involved in cell wall biosynthesis
MKTTVILCSYNHCQSLARTLESLAASILPAEVGWEVLVVDNNSNDRTREVVEGFCRQFPEHFRYLHEPRPGKSFALNSGIAQANADLVAFLDDDVTVEPTWLHNLTANLLNGEWDGAGGKIILGWPEVLPPWLATKGPYSRTPFPDFDKGCEPRQLTEPPFGTNMAFRKEVFQVHGGFRLDLGPSPNREIPCPHEDTEFGYRLMAAGKRLRYEPSAIVYHPIAPDRITKKYFLHWWFDEGRASARVFGVRAGTKWYFAGIPLYLVRSLGLWSLRWMLSMEPHARFYYKIVVWGKLGRISEHFRQRLELKSKKECNA